MIRTGSAPVHQLLSPPVPGSPSFRLPRSESLSGDKTTSATVSLHFEVNRRRDSGIRRALSESQLHGGIHSSPARILGKKPTSFAGSWPEIGIPLEEIGISGGGNGGGDDRGFGNSGGGNSDRSKLGAYYEEMLKANPGDSLLLRNYSKFLHEVEKDTERAEEYYGRAILANPGDGELLSMYGKLIWETQRNQDRAKSYFDQAVSASPDDCTVWGSFAHFMWEAEENNDDDDGDEEISRQSGMMSSPALVSAF